MLRYVLLWGFIGAMASQLKLVAQSEVKVGEGASSQPLKLSIEDAVRLALVHR